MLPEREARDDAADAALHGLRARLQDAQPAVDPVAGPLDVHRPAVVLLDEERLPGQFVHLVVREGEATLILLRHLDGLDRRSRPAGRGARGRSDPRVDELDRLASQVAADDRVAAGPQRGLVDVEFVGVHAPLHDRLAEPVRAGDEDDVPEPGLGVEREHHAARAQVRADHALHPDGESDVAVGEPLVDAVGDRAVAEQRAVDLVHRPQDRVHAPDVEQGILLPRERRLREILGGGGGAHRHGRVGAGPAAEFPVRPLDPGGESRRERRVGDPGPDLAARGGEGCEILDIQRVERLVNAVAEFTRQEIPVRLRGDREAPGHVHSRGGEVGDHLAERGVLSPDRFEIGQPDGLKWRDIPGHGDSQPRPPDDPGRLSQVDRSRRISVR